MSTTTKSTERTRLGRYYDAVGRTVAAHTTDERIEARIAAHNASQGVSTYRQPTPPVTDPSNAVTGPKAKFMDDLLRERVHEYTEVEVVEAKADWRIANRMIAVLKAAPKRPWQPVAPVVEVLTEVAPARTRLDFSEIADGNYAVREDGVVKFYRVSRNGQWVNVQVRASDNLWPVRGKGGIAILHRIVEAGLAESRMLFVTELGRCCKCGRSLTDEDSRANALTNGGYGPDCAGN